MLSLNSFDESYPTIDAAKAGLSLSPLLRPEALRRLAWSTFYHDTILDYGRHGIHGLTEDSFHIQLPCDERTFLLDEQVITQPLHPKDTTTVTSPPAASPSTSGTPPMGMSAHLIRTAAIRRRILHFAHNVKYSGKAASVLWTQTVQLEDDLNAVILSLPTSYTYTTDQVFLHRHRLPTFILLHCMRHNCYIILSRAKLLVCTRARDENADSELGNVAEQCRRDRIARALPTSIIIAEGLKHGANFDPHVGVCAYVALEGEC